MTLLPVVGRELRVAARRRFTLWSRLSAAGLALLIYSALQLIFLAARGSGLPAGPILFGILSWLCFLSACAAGIFLTSDSLSEEKREGTLGLLFLTDLRGYDVVLGKFISTSAQAFYALLAAFPILGLALLSGGVPPGDFWRALLTITNTLFLSLGAGMLVSSLSRDALKAMNATVVLVFVLLLGPQLADFALAGFDPTAVVPRITLASPWHLFTTGGAGTYRHYWLSLGIQHALGWGLLGLTSLLTPRTWQEKTSGSLARQPWQLPRWGSGAARRSAAGRKSRDGNPLLWLAMRNRWLPRLMWALTLIGTGALFWTAIYYESSNPYATAGMTSSSSTTFNGVTTTTVTSNGVTSTTVISNGTTTVTTSGNRTLVFSTRSSAAVNSVAGWLFGVLSYCLTPMLELWMALLACRFFVEAIRNGAMELILVAPLGPEQIVRSQWAALWRTFRAPVLLVVLMKIVRGVITVAEAGSGNPVGNPMTTYLAVNAVVGVIGLVANMIALGWFGMWMGVTNRKISIAVLKIYCLVVVVPTIGFWFVQAFVFAITAFSSIFASSRSVGFNMLWLAAVVAGIVNLLKDIFFITWSRQRLYNNFREAVSVGVAQPVYRSAPPATLPPMMQN